MKRARAHTVMVVTFVFYFICDGIFVGFGAWWFLDFFFFFGFVMAFFFICDGIFSPVVMVMMRLGGGAWWCTVVVMEERE